MISLILLSNPAASLKLNSAASLKLVSGDPNKTTDEEFLKNKAGGIDPFCLDIPTEKVGYKLANGLVKSCVETFEYCLSMEGAYLSHYWDFKVNTTATESEKPMLAAQRRNQRLQYM